MAMLDKTTPQSQVAMRHCIHPSIAWSGSTHRVIANLWCGIAEAQIKFPYAEIPDLSEILSIKPGAGQNLALRALPTARESAALISAMLVHSTSHVVNPPPTESDVSHKQWLTVTFYLRPDELCFALLWPSRSTGHKISRNCSCSLV